MSVDDCCSLCVFVVCFSLCVVCWLVFDVALVFVCLLFANCCVRCLLLLLLEYGLGLFAGSCLLLFFSVDCCVLFYVVFARCCHLVVVACFCYVLVMCYLRVFWVLFIVRCVLLSVAWPSLGVRYFLCVGCCWLIVAFCALYVACCVLLGAVCGLLLCFVCCL